MKRLVIPIAAALVTLSMVVVGCSSAAPATPTQAPQPTKAAAPAAAQPTAAPAAAQPTAAPAAKAVNFPEKGKTITIICLMNAGGSMDLADRVMADMLTKDLGVPVQVVDKPGAGGQVALTELLSSKPDGYTIANNTLPATPVMYLDPERKATFTHADFVNLGYENTEPVTVAVKADSPWKTIQDFVAAVKASPNGIKASVSGVLVTPHLGALEFMRVTGTKLAIVNFDSGPPALTAMLGGHTDVDFEFPGTLSPALKGDQVKILAIMDKQPYKIMPQLPTLASVGIDANMVVTRGYVAPKGTPKDVADVLSGAIKKVATSPEYAQKLADMMIETRYVDPVAADAMWTQQEPVIKQLVDMGKSQMKDNPQ
jgi:tripartite-type tricarboxylate transporter receptor subunit TctC